MDNLPSSAPAPDFSSHREPLPAASVGSGPTTRRSAIFSGSALLVVAALVAVGGVTFAVGRLTAPVAASALVAAIPAERHGDRVARQASDGRAALAVSSRAAREA